MFFLAFDIVERFASPFFALCEPITQGKCPIDGLHIAFTSRQNVAVRVAPLQKRCCALPFPVRGKGETMLPARPNLLTRIRQRLLCRIRRGAEPRLPLAQVGHVLRVAFRGDQSPRSGQQQADKYKKHNRPAAYAGSLCFYRIALLPPCRVLRQNGSMPPYISISSIICVNGDSVKFSARETAKKSAETVQLRKNCRFLSNGSSSFILF